MDQGIVAAFKLFYIRRSFLQLLEATEGSKKLSIREYWRHYSILDAVKNIKFAWDELKSSTMNAVWRKLWVDRYVEEAGVEMPEVAEIVDIAQRIHGDGFADLEPRDITEVLESNGEELIIEDIMQWDVEKDGTIQSFEDNDEEIKKLTAKGLANFLKLANQLSQEALDMDPNMERSLKFKRSLSSALAPYEEFYKEKQRSSKQTSLKDFINSYQKLGKTNKNDDNMLD